MCNRVNYEKVIRKREETRGGYEIALVRPSISIMSYLYALYLNDMDKKVINP